MPHSKNKVQWCLKKAEKELQTGDKHRGLIKIKPDMELAENHVKKAEHNLKAITDFKGIGYSDWSASAAFYSVYHCLLAIIAKLGYESRNQECTFALIYSLIGAGEIELDKELIEDVHLLDTEDKHEAPTLIEMRESEQYGVKLSLEDETFNRLLGIAKAALDQTKVIIES
ncbi:MAG: HEPN domain-containing protein [archaeon]